nr:cytochrome P450 [Sphingomonas sp. Y57]
MDIDLFSPEAIKNPWPYVEQVQAAGPVVYNERIGTWMVTDDQLIRKTLANSDRYKIEGSIAEEVFGPEAFITMDNKARHNALRGIWSVAFQRDSLERLGTLIAGIADEMMDKIEDRFRAGETIDAMAAFGRELPAYVIAHMLGVPDEARPKIVEWSDRIGEGVSEPPNFSRDSNPAWLASEQAKAELADYILGQIEERRRRPGDDLISQIVHSDVGRGLSDHAIMANTRQLLFAGNETTAKWLGHSLVVLAQHPDVRRELVANRGLLPNALEEIMRWEPVVLIIPRLVSGGDAEIAGTRIPEGADISLITAAANRDPLRYEDPNRLNIHREYKANLGFGYGLHSCLGVTLARLEAQVTISRVLDRMPDFVLAGDVDYGAFQLRGPLNVPLALN